MKKLKRFVLFFVTSLPVVFLFQNATTSQNPMDTVVSVKPLSAAKYVQMHELESSSDPKNTRLGEESIIRVSPRNSRQVDHVNVSIKNRSAETEIFVARISKKNLCNGSKSNLPCYDSSLDSFFFRLKVQFMQNHYLAYVRSFNADESVHATKMLPIRATPEVKAPVYDSKLSAKSAIADNIVIFQRSTGGWPKNLNMTETAMTDAEKKLIIQDKMRDDDSTLDNGATIAQLRFLASMAGPYFRKPELMKGSLVRFKSYQTAYLRGLDYLLAAQMKAKGSTKGGGFPQFYPKGYSPDFGSPNFAAYSLQITLNDDAMMNAVSFLNEVAHSAFGSDLRTMTDDGRISLAKAAVKNATAALLRLQLRDKNGKLMAWAQQYDRFTEQPIWARPFEGPAVSGLESMGVLKYLMAIQNPSADVKAAVIGGMRWFEKVALKGQDWRNSELVYDSTAERLWSRYYDLDDGVTPVFFKSRDYQQILYDYRQIDSDLSNYTWFHRMPLKKVNGKNLLETYSEWKKRCDVSSEQGSCY